MPSNATDKTITATSLDSTMVGVGNVATGFVAQLHDKVGETDIVFKSKDENVSKTVHVTITA